MDKPKRHHYLPESYQKGFWDERTRKIYFVDIESGKRAATDPKNIGLEKHLYAQTQQLNPGARKQQRRDFHVRLNV